MSTDNYDHAPQVDEPLIDTFDLIFLLIAGGLAVLYLYRDTLFKKNVTTQPAPVPSTTLKPASGPPKKNRDFLKRMKETVSSFITFIFQFEPI